MTNPIPPAAPVPRLPDLAHRPHGVRPATPCDRAALVAMLARCSATTRRRRFLSPATRFPEPYLTEALEGVLGHHTLVACSSQGLSGMASCVRVGDATAEVAVLVEDAWQGYGLGERLLGLLVEHADRTSVTELTATVHPDDTSAIEAMAMYGLCRSRPDPCGDVVEVSLTRVTTPAGIYRS